ncbi:MAG: hypothetical protein EAZ89_02030 [Bacteroidetes bacterium]|nr:MAG: hypothetical protein EAZ89_02030 [Bacteroidota bacterium]
MDAMNVNQRLVETYMAMLRHLSQDDKLELISKLQQSMAMKIEKKRKVKFRELFGAFLSNKTAEEQIEEIRQARVFNREIEEF